MVANGDILTQREALAGLLADPRVATGMLTTTVRRVYRYVGFRTRTRRGRVVSAGSPYHYVSQPNGTFLGVLKVAPGDRTALADVAGRAGRRSSTARCPDGWQERAGRQGATAGSSRSTGARSGRWPSRRRRRAAVRRGARRRRRQRPASAGDVELDPPRARRSCARRVAAAEQDAPALLLCGLVRSEVAGRRQPPAAPVLDAPADAPSTSPRRPQRIGEHDEDRALLDSAVKASDGFFTTFFVSPYSKYIARWAARRGWTPNGVTTLSVAVGFAGRRGVRDRRPLGDDRRRGPAPARVHVRLRRRAARALHAHVHQARRVAGLDLRPHEGVRGLRRAWRSAPRRPATTCGCWPARR